MFKKKEPIYITLIIIKKIIDGIISNIYSKSNELALINNELVSPGTLEYIEYQLLRTTAKKVATEVFKII
jgi:hypothetical protein